MNLESKLATSKPNVRQEALRLIELGVKFVSMQQYKERLSSLGYRLVPYMGTRSSSEYYSLYPESCLNGKSFFHYEQKHNKELVRQFR